MTVNKGDNMKTKENDYYKSVMTQAEIDALDTTLDCPSVSTQGEYLAAVLVTAKAARRMAEEFAKHRKALLAVVEFESHGATPFYKWSQIVDNCRVVLSQSAGGK